MKILSLFQNIHRRIMVRRINRALGIELFDFQIAKIFDDEPFPDYIQRSRRCGKTTAQILFILLNKKFKNKVVLLHVDDHGNLQGFRITENQFAVAVARTFGEDGITFRRRDFFAKELLETKKALSNHHIKTNVIAIKKFKRTHTYK